MNLILSILAFFATANSHAASSAALLAETDATRLELDECAGKYGGRVATPNEIERGLPCDPEERKNVSASIHLADYRNAYTRGYESRLYILPTGGRALACFRICALQAPHARYHFVVSHQVVRDVQDLSTSGQCASQERKPKIPACARF